MMVSTLQGIIALKTELEKKYRVWVVAPDREKSAISMALTLNHPLRISQVEENVYAVNGTTADCVNIALQKILPVRPDFVVSGMNLGENLSEDIFFSGTVGGAFSGYLYGIPSLAVSLLAGLGQYQKQKFEFAQGAADQRQGPGKASCLPRQRRHLQPEHPLPQSR